MSYLCVLGCSNVLHGCVSWIASVSWPTSVTWRTWMSWPTSVTWPAWGTWLTFVSWPTSVTWRAWVSWPSSVTWRAWGTRHKSKPRHSSTPSYWSRPRHKSAPSYWSRPRHLSKPSTSSTPSYWSRPRHKSKLRHSTEQLPISKCLLDLKLYYNSFWCETKYCLYFIYARLHGKITRVDLHCRVIFTCVNKMEPMYVRPTDKHSSWARFNFYVFTQPSIHILIYLGA